MSAEEREILAKKIFRLSPGKEFEDTAMELFSYQAHHNKVYQTYLKLLGVIPKNISTIKDIPFMPVSFFKTHKVITGKKRYSLTFKSSGTGTGSASRHFVADSGLYTTSLTRCFELFYGNPSDYCILALLPSYLERGDSSLVYMVRQLAEMSAHPESGFYLNDLDQLAFIINKLEKNNQRALLIGVSFALLDLVEKHSFSLKNTILMETGGMKGRRKEPTREELHSILKSRTALKHIHSEYGMTELLSQAYSKSDGKFCTPPWMKVLIRDAYDPFSYLEPGRNGGVNIIDLANIDSCAFIETADLGKMLPGGEFEILGRFDNTDIRGCNLLAG